MVHNKKNDADGAIHLYPNQSGDGDGFQDRFERVDIGKHNANHDWRYDKGRKNPTRRADDAGSRMRENEPCEQNDPDANRRTANAVSRSVDMLSDEANERGDDEERGRVYQNP